MKVKEKNIVTKGLVEDLHKKGFEKHKLLGSIAKNLNRPRRVRFEVNLSSIEKFAKDRETVVVPGVVLGNGEIKKHVNVAALKFSDSAKKKIEKTGGKCLSIQEFTDDYKKGQKIRIMG